MPFKLTNALVTFYAIINAALNKYFSVFTLIYLNNILIYTKETLKKHVKKVKQVLTKL